jgi:hypothetical protein
VQPTRDEMEQTVCAEFPPWKNRRFDFVWEFLDTKKIIADLDVSRRDLFRPIQKKM